MFSLLGGQGGLRSDCSVLYTWEPWRPSRPLHHIKNTAHRAGEEPIKYSFMAPPLSVSLSSGSLQIVKTHTVSVHTFPSVERLCVCIQFLGESLSKVLQGTRALFRVKCRTGQVCLVLQCNRAQPAHAHNR